MGNKVKHAALVLTGGVLLSVLSGCTISFHPGLGFSKPAPNGPPAPPPGQDPWPPMPAYQGRGKDPYGLPPPNVPGGPGGPSSEVVTLMRQRLIAAEEERKVLVDRIQEVEAQLQDKQQAVKQANYEVQDSIKQIRKTRDELSRWKSDMDDLRAKIRNMEMENKQTLETIVKTLEKYVEPPR